MINPIKWWQKWLLERRIIKLNEDDLELCDLEHLNVVKRDEEPFTGCIAYRYKKQSGPHWALVEKLKKSSPTAPYKEIPIFPEQFRNTVNQNLSLILEIKDLFEKLLRKEIQYGFLQKNIDNTEENWTFFKRNNLIFRQLFSHSDYIREDADSLRYLLETFDKNKNQVCSERHLYVYKLNDYLRGTLKHLREEYDSCG